VFRIRIGSGFQWVSGSGSRSWEDKIVPPNKEKMNKFLVFEDVFVGLEASPGS
jgi:hypothetical protein